MTAAVRSISPGPIAEPGVNAYITETGGAAGSMAAWQVATQFSSVRAIVPAA
jgi:hypothetical protein